MFKIFYKYFSKRKDKNRLMVINSGASVPLPGTDEFILIKDKDKNKWLKFICPCGCGKEITVNLMSGSPWRASVNKGKISVFPSVVVKECNGHFWIRDSKFIKARFR